MRTRVRGTHCPGAASRAWASLPRGKESLARGSRAKCQCQQEPRAARGAAPPGAPQHQLLPQGRGLGQLPRGAESLGHQEEAGMDTSVLQIRHERQGMETSSMHSLLGQEAVSSASYRISFVPNHLQETQETLTHILQV